jgi:hypothetical protein
VRYDIRFAALAADAERRVRLAVRALAMPSVETSLEPWQGSGCTAVVVDSLDGYGRHVMDVATRRGVAVLALGDANAASDRSSFANLPTDASIASIAQALKGLLGLASTSEARRPAPRDPERSEAGDAGGLIQLARSDAWRESDLEARFGPRTIYLARADGRAIAHTLSDLIEARNQLCQGDWQFREVAPGAAADAGAEVSTSLDTLLVQAALRGESQLPPFPAVACTLAHWPDLGAATDALDAMRLAAPMLRRACTPKELALLTGLEESRVHACLWAFEAAGSLRRTQSASESPPAARTMAPQRSLWSRFASHFGLGSPAPATAGGRH